ncbi:MAG: D-serine ammonia-lyase [Desulfonatronovibrionaceae bacterium]
MEEKIIAGTSIKDWVNKYPLLKPIMSGEEVFWTNPDLTAFEIARSDTQLTMQDIQEADALLHRFRPYLAKRFPQTQKTEGILESPLIRVPELKKRLCTETGTETNFNFLLKGDNNLPISGSIKARGGFYAVLKTAEELALEKGHLRKNDDYSRLTDKEFKKFFSKFGLTVGSTGNLGLSIGIMGAALGFKTCVHMSAEAREWKKDLLREKGVQVVEHCSDYSLAVEQGRKEARNNPDIFFVDDENSVDLFLGYAVAALRLKKELKEIDIKVDSQHPLFVYLPCGVGGGPGGITFGLKQVFGDHVHCFFAEPTSSPCMLLGLLSGLHNRISVHDFGLNNVTAADGLAVGRASAFVGRTLQRQISGVYTIGDRLMYNLLALSKDTEGIDLEPSALAGMPGPFRLMMTREGQDYLQKQRLDMHMAKSTHIVWITGGGMVPEEEIQRYYAAGKKGKIQDIL